MSPKKEAKEGESKTESSDQDEQTKASPPRKQVPVDEDPTLTRTSVKCNNNSFSSWDGFSEAMDSCLSEPGQADFFDLSFKICRVVRSIDRAFFHTEKVKLSIVKKKRYKTG